MSLKGTWSALLFLLRACLWFLRETDLLRGPKRTAPDGAAASTRVFGSSPAGSRRSAVIGPLFEAWKERVTMRSSTSFPKWRKAMRKLMKRSLAVAALTAAMVGQAVPANEQLPR